MPPSISAPQFIASFNQPSSSKSPKKPTVAGSTHDSHHVRVSPLKGYKGKSASGGEQVAIAVDGEGVWRYDVTTANPTGSHTVPPATTFATSPVCLTSPSTEARMTVIGISKSEGISKAQQDRSIWCWRGDDSEKEVLELPQPINQLLYLNSFPEHLLVHSPASPPSLISTSTSPLTHTPSTIESSSASTSVPVFLRVYPRRNCSFLPASPNGGDVLVEVSSRGIVQIYTIQSLDGLAEPSIELAREIKSIEGVKALEGEEILQVTLNDKGTMQVLTNHSHFYTLNLSSTTLTSALPTYTFPSPSPSLTTLVTPSAMALSPYSLLLQPQTSHIHLLSPLFPAVLSTLNLPPTLAANHHIEPIALTGGKIALVVSPPAEGAGAGGKIGVWMVEVVGGGGSGAGGIGEVMFTGEKTNAVLVPVSSHHAPTPKPTLSNNKNAAPLSSTEPFSTLLPRIRTSLHSSTTHTPVEIRTQTEKIWLEELALEEDRLKSQQEQQTSRGSKSKTTLSLPTSTAQSLLSCIFSSSLPKEAYPSAIISSLLHKSLITENILLSYATSSSSEDVPSSSASSTSMARPLSAHLLAHDDWHSLSTLLRSPSAASQVSEHTVVALLDKVLKLSLDPTHQPKKTERIEPTPQQFLYDVCRFGVQADGAGWKEAVGKMGIDEITLVLVILDGWLARLGEAERDRSGLPATDEVIPLITLILDTHLLALLSTPDTSALLLSTIADHLAPHLKLQRELEQAKATLEGCMRMGRAVARKNAANAAVANSKAGKKAVKGAARAVDTQEMGVYRLEEFML